jgi:peroxiredoxin
VTRARRAALLLGGLVLLGAAALLAANAGRLGTALLSAAPAPLTTVSATRVVFPGGALQPGQPAPDFTLSALDGAPVRLADYRGQTVLINFWASWCLPCREEMPLLNEAHSGGRLVVIGVNALNLDEERDARDFVAEMGVSFPIAFDADGAVQRAYSVRGLPTSFVVGPDGVVQSLQIGQLRREQLAEYLAAP